jgi:hypothetical protein
MNNGRDLVLGATEVFVLRNDQLVKVPKLGGTITSLVPSLVNPWRLALVGSTVYWTSPDQARVFSIPTAGGTTATVWAGTPSQRPLQITADSSSLYFMNLTDLRRVPLSGGAGTALIASSGPGPLTTDAASVYFSEGGIRKIPVGGGTATTLASGAAYEMSVAAGQLFWTNHVSGDVLKISVNGGAVTTIATGQSFLRAIGTDSTHVYWVTSGALRRAPLAGGPSVEVTPSSSDVIAVEADTTAIYWIQNSGRVMRAAK